MATQEETAAQLADAREKLAAAETAHAAAVAADAPPRAPGEIIIALFRAFVDRLGNRPNLEALVDELEEAFEVAVGLPTKVSAPAAGDPAPAGDRA